MDQEKTVLIVFGITGHLSLTKLLPALKFLKEKARLPKNFRLIGIGRRDLSENDLLVINQITPDFVYLKEDLTSDRLYQNLSQKISAFPHQIYFLATFPELYQQIIQNLARFDLHKQNRRNVKILIEKPLGVDSTSSELIVKLLCEYFNPNQIYPIDHYLGKDPVQNILAFRFANPIFEELLNCTYVENIQITGAENFGIETRGRFYDKTGSLKDVGQNHILQLLTFATMDSPKSLSSVDIHQEKIALLENFQPLPNTIVLGQYAGYTQESDVSSHSQTDTFFAFEGRINNQRWKDVPIYLRSGKNLAMTVTEVSIVFRNLPTPLFPTPTHPNILTYRVQPNEGIVLTLDTKKPGFSMEIEPTFMQYCYKYYAEKLPDPYEKLILDALLGDKTFFPTFKEIDLQWKIIDKLLENRPNIQIYQPQSWGPKITMPFAEPSPLICRI